MKTYIILLAALSLALFSCKKDDLTLSGEPSAVGLKWKNHALTAREFFSR